MKNCATVLVTFLCLFILAEAFSRVFADRPGDNLGRPDSTYGRSYLPNVTMRMESPNGEYSTTVKTNSLGFRDDDHPFDKPAGRRRILVVGDSFMVGREVGVEAIFSSVLEETLVERGYPYEVVTTAVEGYSPVNEYLLFKNVGRRFSPDVVVLTFCFNEVTEDVQRTERAVLDSLGLPIRIPPAPGQLADYGSTRTSSSVLVPIKSWLLNHSRFYSFVRSRLHAYRLRRHARETFRRVYSYARTGDIAIDMFAVFKDSLDAVDRAAWQQTFRYVREIDKLCRSIGARLLVVMIPPGNQINRDEWGVGKREYKFGEDEFLESTTLQDRVRERCSEAGISTVDLLPNLRNNSSPAHRIHFQHDGHWTEHGHRIAADTVFQYLESNHWLDS